MLKYSLFLSALLLTACTSVPEQQILSINRYTQSDYEYNCLDGTKTFTEIILCYKAQDTSEKIQNKITNDLINKDKIEQE